MIVYCTRFTRVDNCLKICIIPVFRSIDMLVIYFCFILLKGVSFYVTYIHSFNFLLNLQQSRCKYVFFLISRYHSLFFVFTSKFSKWHNYLSKDILDFVLYNRKILRQFKKFFCSNFQTWIPFYCQDLLRMWLTLPRNFFRFSYLLLVIVSKELELAMSIASVRERTDFKRTIFF